MKSFEKEVQDAGALTKSFKDDDGLRLEVGIILDRIARTFSSKGTIRAGFSSSKAASPSPSGTITSTVPDLVDDDDLGLFDIIERLQQHADIAGRFLDGMTSSLRTMSQVTGDVADEFQAIRDVRPLEPAETKPGIQRVADAMNSFSDLLESELPSYAENLNAMGNDARDMVRVSYDWIDSGEDMLTHLWSFRTVLSNMFGVIGDNQTSLSDMLETTSALQRTTSFFNKAKRRIIYNSTRLIEVNESGRAIIGLALDELGRLIVAVEERNGRKDFEG